MGMSPQSATTGTQAATPVAGRPNIQQILQALQAAQQSQQGGGVPHRQLPQMGRPNAPQFMQRMAGPAAINQAYQQYLGRAPEAAGAQFWNQARQNGLDMNGIRSSIFQSPEAQAFRAGGGMGGQQPIAGGFNPAPNYSMFQPALNGAAGYGAPPRAMPAAQALPQMMPQQPVPPINPASFGGGENNYP